MRADDAPVIAVADLTKTYDETVAVDSASFSIYENEIFALLGPNGAGKTTTVEILECLRTPTDGEATVFGTRVTDNSEAIKRRIGVVPQSFHTFDRLTVRENIELVADMYSDPVDVDTVLDRLDLTEYASSQFQSLSGGYQRRTGIGMALVGDPDILFLDEPTTGLDPAARRTTWGQIERLAEHGTTIVLTTHYMDEVEALADRAAIMVDGSIFAVDTVANLIEEYGGEVKLVVEPSAASADTGLSRVRRELDELASDVYETEAGEVVGVFNDRGTAQDAFSRIHSLDGDHPINLVSAGMADVFLEIAGGRLDETGELV